MLIYQMATDGAPPRRRPQPSNPRPRRVAALVARPRDVAQRGADAAPRAATGAELCAAAAVIAHVEAWGSGEAADMELHIQQIPTANRDYNGDLTVSNDI